MLCRLEMQEYVQDPDESFAAEAIRAIGRCAITLPELSDECLQALLGLARSASGKPVLWRAVSKLIPLTYWRARRNYCGAIGAGHPHLAGDMSTFFRGTEGDRAPCAALSRGAAAFTNRACHDLLVGWPIRGPRIDGLGGAGCAKGGCQNV